LKEAREETENMIPNLVELQHRNDQEEKKRRLLSRINSEIPNGIDWKEGARTYCRNYIADHGEHVRTWELVKPFVDGPDFWPFFQHLYTFLNVIETVNLPKQANVLDVACGGGWVTHLLAKLGHNVVGIDICDELLDIARERLAADPFSAIHGKPLSAAVRCHDIEVEPVAERGHFDLAVLESAMHHLFDPVSAFANLALSLKRDGAIAVIEGGAPPKDSEEHRHLVDVMAKYKTLERPYERQQVLELLDLTGFRHRRFFNSVNGLFEETSALDGAIDGLVRCGPGWNLFIAGRTPESMERLKRDFRLGAREDNAPIVFHQGFYATEVDEHGDEFRWSRPRSALRVRRESAARLEFRSFAPEIYRREQTIHLYLNGTKEKVIVLRPGEASGAIVLPELASSTKIDLYSDTCFCPLMTGGSDDRVLSFMLRVFP
jgi:SAM-dependent methyltransferase